MTNKTPRSFGPATVHTRKNGTTTAFMVLPVRHAAELAETLRRQGRDAFVTF